MTADKSVPQCKYCVKEFKYESERKRHEKSHFPQFTCKVCSKNFSFLSALRRHEKQHERTGSVHCDKCARTFRDPSLLKRHINYAHGVESFLCSKCDAKFGSYTALSTHLKTHKAGSERKYRCRFMGCKKAFNFSHHLKHHELTHTNTKQHFCSICNKGFIQSHHLKTHLKTHDPDLSVYCSFTECHKKFATDSARKRHETKYHSPEKGDCLKETEDFTSHKLYTLFDTDVTQDNTPEDLSIQKMVNDAASNEFSNCKTVFGHCIAIAGQDCVCDQIPNIPTEDSTEELDFAPIELDKNIKANIRTNDITTEIDCVNVEIRNKLNIDDIKFDSPCDGCECANHCNVINIITAGAIEVMPTLEYNNGALKLKDMFDINIAADTDKGGNRGNMKFAPYSCKAVIGNCIVSGNGSIDEQCLCARMTDEQVTSQEIEDITPHPNE